MVCPAVACHAPDRLRLPQAEGGKLVALENGG